MSNDVNSQVDWDHIVAQSFSQDPKSRDQAMVMAHRKEVEAYIALQGSIFSLQRVMGHRLEKLSEAITEIDKSSKEVAKANKKLTLALVTATIIQAIAATAAVIVGLIALHLSKH